MREFFISNGTTVLVLIPVCAALFLAVRKIIKNKKSGKSCSCGCDSCAFKDDCHKK